jgi:molybdopterin converting factor small subunit
MSQQRVTVRVTSALRRLAENHASVEVRVSCEPVTAGEVLAALGSCYPGVHDAALDERGHIRQHVNVFVGADNIRLADGLATPVPAGVEVWILPAVSGGSSAE